MINFINIIIWFSGVGAFLMLVLFVFRFWEVGSLNTSLSERTRILIDLLLIGIALDGYIFALLYLINFTN